VVLLQHDWHRASTFRAFFDLAGQLFNFLSFFDKR
jgi:hypothetical protein